MVTHGHQQSGCSIKRQGQHLWGSEYFYRPQRSWGKVMFLQVSVILLTGGCLPQCMLGYHYPPGTDTPQKQTPPWTRHLLTRTPQSRQPHWEQTPPGPETPWEQTPPDQTSPGSRHPPEQTPPGADTSPWEQTPPTPWSRHPPPPRVDPSSRPTP